jgi:hypothetical protein
VTACLRDVNTYIDALKYDLKYPGNYKSRFAARYYANSVTGSLEEDMYYLRDATGIRDQTLQGLTGDLLAENEFGTSRVSAGAYCNLIQVGAQKIIVLGLSHVHHTCKVLPL